MWRCVCKACRQYWLVDTDNGVEAVCHQRCPRCGSEETEGERLDESWPCNLCERPGMLVPVPGWPSVRLPRCVGHASVLPPGQELRAAVEAKEVLMVEALQLRALLREAASDVSLCRWPSVVWLRKACALLGMDQPGGVFGPNPTEGQHGAQGQGTGSDHE